MAAKLSDMPQLPTYYATPQTSAVSASTPQTYTSLAAAADAERRLAMQRAAERQNAVLSGYQQQIANARMLGDQGYGQLAANYGQVASDAADTRTRNMARIDQYGTSMKNDLAIKNQQALAAANQSAIKRGLGNTTIVDSLQRGVNFDNTRQMMSLDDQLLQNRIATDSQLSNVYQAALQNKAQALNAQWNQNIGTENQLTGQRLGYLGSLQDDMQGFNTVANLYGNQLQMENANQQALLQMQNSNYQAELQRRAQTPGLYMQQWGGRASTANGVAW